jgi:hypothetical protein
MEADGPLALWGPGSPLFLSWDVPEDDCLGGIIQLVPDGKGLLSKIPDLFPGETGYSIWPVGRPVVPGKRSREEGFTWGRNDHVRQGCVNVIHDLFHRRMGEGVVESLVLLHVMHQHTPTGQVVAA